MEYEKYREAGRIARRALEYGLKIVKEGKSYKEVAEDIENYIKERANLAFPVNISVNSVAAHYTPSINDKNFFKKGDVVKLDVGVHIDGYIGDTAGTIEIGKNAYKNLIKSAEEALKEAIKIIRDGIKIEDIGKKIEECLNKHGYKPIRNLHGHSLERYKLHAGISIPNYYRKDRRILRDGQVIAIEPFSTNGEGIVVDNGLGNIYRIVKNSPIIRKIKDKYDELPFADRWLYKIYGEKTYSNLSIFMKRGIVSPYFKLVEIKKGIVAQAEHTVLVKEDGCEILTK